VFAIPILTNPGERMDVVFGVTVVEEVAASY
jgi:hypothetical protein